MKKIVTFPVWILAILFIVSCKGSYKELNLNEVPEQTIFIKKSVAIDSCSGVNLFLYNKNVIVVAPQNSFGKYPYYLYDMDSLYYVGAVGRFGHSSQEFVDVNPYYIIKSDTSFVQCTDGYFESVYTIKGGQLDLLHRKKISSLNMNGLCKVDDNSYIFWNEDLNDEFVYFSSKNKDYSKFGKYPSKEFPIKNQDDYLSFYEKATSVNNEKGLFFSFYTNIPIVRIFNKEREEISSIIIDNCSKGEQYYDDFVNDRNKTFYCMARYFGQYTYALYHGTIFPTPYSEIHVWDDSGNIINRIVLNKWIKCFDIDIESKRIYGIYVDEEDYLFSAYYA